MIKLLFSLSLACLLFVGDCGSKKSQSPEQPATPTEQPDSLKEAPKHNAPDQARIDSIKQAKREAKRNN